ncbi:Pet127-domain-containing protein [Polychaeton citri CBS 116435]|uniref:Pet127-domain-containing protein n=1 Tax=Polychaeton citri CBS 116435 TaxID=1314669 RepID=A0A9P4Q6R4_9PEZI|nr:Pet127-domain-containing protein [Polychaeton citri CBS 116435]
MYNPVRHISRSSSIAHVCLSCRRQLAFRQPPQRRHYASIEPSNDARAVDDYATAFNDISKDYGDSARPRRHKGKAPTAGTSRAESKSARDAETGGGDDVAGEERPSSTRQSCPADGVGPRPPSEDSGGEVALPIRDAMMKPQGKQMGRTTDGSGTSSMQKGATTKLRAKMLARNSGPKWGDTPRKSDVTSKSVESFESLREADKISPVRPLPPTTSRPFGIDKASNVTLDLSQNTSSDAKHGKATSSQKVKQEVEVNINGQSVQGARDGDTSKGAGEQGGREGEQKNKRKREAAKSKRAQLIEQRRAARAKAKELKEARNFEANGKTAGKSQKKKKASSSTPKKSKEKQAQYSMGAVEAFLKQATAPGSLQDGSMSNSDLSTGSNVDIAKSVVTINASDLTLTPLSIEQPPVPGLTYGLDRVLFNSGVYQLQDPHSQVYNFDPYLQKIMPVVEFDFNSLKEYKTSSKDTTLATIAEQCEKKYIGSTSSMTGMLSHFHYLLSNFRPLNCLMLSRGFPDKSENFTNLTRAPNAAFLRWKDGTYAIDADKEFDSGNVLMMLGKSMEKLLTLSKDDYERYRKSDTRSISEEERNAEEAYHYTTMGDFLMRSQLDAYDPRLPGTGMFDLKTRAVVSVRMDARDYEPMTGYEIQTLQGRFESYEREYFDMMRSTMLKYMLQARMGRMDGIFVAYHNVERIFGFQYLPMHEIDRALHGQVDRCLGDQEFKLSLELLNKVLDEATAKFPEKSLRLHFETQPDPVCAMYVFAEPMEDEEIETLQNTGRDKIAEFEQKMLGIENAEAGLDEGEQDAAVSAAASAAHDTIKAGTGQTTPNTVVEAASSDNVSNSTARNDEAFIASIGSEDPHASRPLYAATLICKSRVNGTTVNSRITRLKPDDEWTLDYLLAEIEDPKDAWAMYEACKARRKDAYVFSNDESVDEDGNTEKQESTYITYLKELSSKGREFRGKMDELRNGQEAVVFGHPPSSQKSSGSDEKTE